MSKSGQYAKKGAIAGAVIGAALGALALNPITMIAGAISWGIAGALVGAGIGVLSRREEQPEAPCASGKVMTRNARGCPMEIDMTQGKGQSATHFQDKVSAQAAPEAIQR